MEQIELDTRFTYHTPHEGQPNKYIAIRNAAKALAMLFNEVCPESREKSTAFTDLESSVMWANAAIARRS